MGSREKGKQRGGASSPRVRKGEFPIRAEDYELLEPIGDGATAVVRRARCLPLGGEVVAIKIMNMTLRSDPDMVRTSSDQINRFLPRKQN
jgi:serine/threonine-protein kinase OSR1/STK39